jgi:hypothetical protein
MQTVPVDLAIASAPEQGCRPPPRFCWIASTAFLTTFVRAGQLPPVADKHRRRLRRVEREADVRVRTSWRNRPARDSTCLSGTAAWASGRRRRTHPPSAADRHLPNDGPVSRSKVVRSELISGRSGAGGARRQAGVGCVSRSRGDLGPRLPTRRRRRWSSKLAVMSSRCDDEPACDMDLLDARYDRRRTRTEKKSSGCVLVDMVSQCERMTVASCAPTRARSRATGAEQNRRAVDDPHPPTRVSTEISSRHSPTAQLDQYERRRRDGSFELLVARIPHAPVLLIEPARHR